jgi:alanine dehydrogenase
MIIGIPKEIKEHEYRVGMTPSGVGELVKEGHRVIIEESAGTGSGFPDEDYQKEGAEVAEKTGVFHDAELIVKVKEPLPREYDLFRDGQALFTFLHLAAAPELTEMLLDKNITGFAYETVEVNGSLPLLKPMSEVAGKMAPIVAAYYLQKIYGGGGVLMTGAGGVSPARVLVLGAGTVGMNALQVAYGMGAHVTVLNRGEKKLRIIDELYRGDVRTLRSTEENIEAEAVSADVVIGAVLIPGAKSPKLISRELISRMKKGAVIVDVSVDQGGCIETTKPTTHDNPVYAVDGVIHYTVANMPGAYPRTSTQALADKTIEYIKMLAETGIERAVMVDGPLKSALNTYKGNIMHEAVARAMP